MIHRRLALPLHRAAAGGAPVLVQGPRGAGKTTLLRREFPGHTYVSLDEASDREQARQQPARFLHRLRGPSIIDSLHRAPELAAFLSQSPPGPWLVASSHRLRLPFPALELYPPTLAERERRPPLSLDLLGRFSPAPTSNTPAAPVWPQDPRALENDFRDLVRPHDFDRFLAFYRHARDRSGEILDQQSLARQVSISHRTAVRWLEALDTCFLTLLLPPSHLAFGRRTVRRPTLHFFDSPLLTSRVISELYRNARHAGDLPDFRHWRDSNGFGLPLILQNESDPPVPVEIAHSPTPASLERLRRWMRLAAVSRAALITEKPGFTRAAGILRYPVDQL